MANGFRVGAARHRARRERHRDPARLDGELTSGFSRDNASTIMVDSRVARDAQRQAARVARDLVVVDPAAQARRRRQRHRARRLADRLPGAPGRAGSSQGRQFTPGLYELVVGKQGGRALRGRAQVGATDQAPAPDLAVVGVFSSEGSGFESEVWGDVDVHGPGVQPRQRLSVADAAARGPIARLDAFNEDLKRNPPCRCSWRASAHSTRNSRADGDDADGAGGVRGGWSWAIGAMFGAMNTMYGFVAARTREIGTLRALGFSRVSDPDRVHARVGVSGARGGLVGCLLALPVNFALGRHRRRELLAGGLRLPHQRRVAGHRGVAAVFMGIFGGLLPSFRAARTPITAALRDA